MTRSNGKLLLLAVMVVVCLWGCGSNSPVPAPYTNEAYVKLNQALSQFGTPVPPSGQSKQDRVKFHVDHLRKIYSKAGYDFNLSVQKICEDFDNDIEATLEAMRGDTAAKFTWDQLGRLKKAADQEKVDLGACLSEGAGKAYGSLMSTMKGLQEIARSLGIARTAILAYYNLSLTEPKTTGGFATTKSFNSAEESREIYGTDLATRYATYGYDEETKTITATIRNLGRSVNGKTIELKGPAYFQGKWTWGGTLSSFYLPENF